MLGEAVNRAAQQVAASLNEFGSKLATARESTTRAWWPTSAARR